MKVRSRKNNRTFDLGRRRARQDILDSANNFIAGRGNQGRVLTTRHLHEAVCIVRRHLLLSDQTLVLAGFNGVTERKKPR